METAPAPVAQSLTGARVALQRCPTLRASNTGYNRNGMRMAFRVGQTPPQNRQDDPPYTNPFPVLTKGVTLPPVNTYCVKIELHWLAELKRNVIIARAKIFRWRQRHNWDRGTLSCVIEGFDDSEVYHRHLT